MSDRPSDPFDELRHADPATAGPAPSESKGRVWAHIQEVTMNESTPRRTTARWALGIGALGAAAALAVGVFVSRGASPTPSADPGVGIGSCVETYSAAAVASRDFAFDGTVAGIEGDDVTFTVNEAFSGDLGSSITLNPAGMTGTSVTSAGGPSLAVGGRYLVAGDDTFVWACGFTQPYDAGVAAEWKAATD